MMPCKPAAVLIAANLAVAACASTTVGSGRHPGRSGDVVVVGHETRAPRALGHVPPGHYPPPGSCRLWFPGRPPGHQPPPTRCGALVGRVPHGAFVLYNDRAWDADYDWRRYEQSHPGTVPQIILEVLAAVVR